MNNKKIKVICCLACEELDVFITLTKQLLEKNLSHPTPIDINNYIIKIYEISHSIALPQFVSLFEEYSDNNPTAALNCQYAINQLNIFYNTILPNHISDLSRLFEKNVLSRDCLTGFIYSIEIIKKNLAQHY